MVGISSLDLKDHAGVVFERQGQHVHAPRGDAESRGEMGAKAASEGMTLVLAPVGSAERCLRRSALSRLTSRFGMVETRAMALRVRLRRSVVRKARRMNLARFRMRVVRVAGGLLGAVDRALTSREDSQEKSQGGGRLRMTEDNIQMIIFR